MSSPLAQTASFNSSLTFNFSSASPDHCQVEPSTLVSGMPWFQFSPLPSPRKYSVLPKPTSILASMVALRLAFGIGLVSATAGVGAGAGATDAAALIGLVSATGIAATCGLAAGALAFAGLVSMAGLVTFFAAAGAVANGFFLVVVFLTGFMVQFLVWIYTSCPFSNSSTSILCLKLTAQSKSNSCSDSTEQLSN